MVGWVNYWLNSSSALALFLTIDTLCDKIGFLAHSLLVQTSSMLPADCLLGNVPLLEPSPPLGGQTSFCEYSNQLRILDELFYVEKWQFWWWRQKLPRAVPWKMAGWNWSTSITVPALQVTVQTGRRCKPRPPGRGTRERDAHVQGKEACSTVWKLNTSLFERKATWTFPCFVTKAVSFAYSPDARMPDTLSPSKLIIILMLKLFVNCVLFSVYS